MPKTKKREQQPMHTNVFATKKEMKEATRLAKIASSKRIFGFTMESTLHAERDANKAWENARKFCHKCALKHGLPEIKGYYGLSIDGEFVSF